ncbi:MAG: hypothetical protein V1644_02880 [Candidatus Micrarchaeota archaeon]
MVYVTLRFEGLPAEILENALKKGLGKTKSEVLRMGLFKLNDQYNLAGKDFAIASEKSLAKDWLSKEDELAWKHL